jgi:hypothetical protein
MIKKIQFSFAIMLAITFFAFGSVAFAQTNASNSLQATSETAISADYDVSVQPVKFFDKVKLFLTFNAEKKADLLSDFSKRNFVLATQNFEQGNTAQAEVLLQKSEMDMARANIAATKIIQPEKRDQAMDRMSSENAVRAEVLINVQSRLENPVAQEALGRAITRQQIAVDFSANQNAGTREGNTNGTILGSAGVAVSSDDSQYPNCDPTMTPYVKVLSPNGGETYVVDQEIAVRWETCNLPIDENMAIDLFNANDTSSGNCVLSGQTANVGLKVVSLGVESCQYLNFEPGNNFKVRVYQLNPTPGSSVQDFSDDLFSINESGSEIIADSCLTVDSIAQGSTVTFPLTITGTINYACWGIFEGEAGFAHIKQNGQALSTASVDSGLIRVTSAYYHQSDYPIDFTATIPSISGGVSGPAQLVITERGDLGEDGNVYTPDVVTIDIQI